MNDISQVTGPIISVVLSAVIGGMIARSNKKREKFEERVLSKIDDFSDMLHALDKAVALNNQSINAFKERIDKQGFDINNFFKRAKKIETFIDQNEKI
jgi:predicted HTH domain antitoxin